MKNIPYDVPGFWEGCLEFVERRGIDRPRVVIHGGYGKRNLGDDAILHVLIKRTKRYLPKAHITVICHGPDNVRKWYPDISIYHFKSLSTLLAIIKSNIYIIGGGGIVNIINVYSGRKTFKIFDMKGKFLFFAAHLAKFSGAKTHFYAIGATSFPDPGVKILARIVLSKADFVSVRDPLSIKNIRGIGVKRKLFLVLDPALSMETAPRKDVLAALNECGMPERGSRPFLCLNMRYIGDRKTDNKKTLLETMRLVEYLIDQKKCDVLFMPASQHPTKHLEDDLDFGRRLKAELGEIPHFYLMEKYYHPRVMMGILAEMDFCILERLHTVILASKVGVPFLAISYDNKVTEYVKLIEKEKMMIGIEEFKLSEVQEKIDPYLDKIRLNS
ncbi:MAG: polysaccharide pyruvyl transferase family protein [bacterium]